MTFVDTQRAALHTRLASLVKRSAGLEHHLRNEDGRLDSDSEDRVAYTMNDEVVAVLDTETRSEVGAIRNALARMDAGTWCDCEVCGEPIGESRLAALPTASKCVDCAS